MDECVTGLTGFGIVSRALYTLGIVVDGRTCGVCCGTRSRISRVSCDNATLASDYYFGNFARRIQIVLPSCLQRVHGHPDIEASHRTLRRWHQEQAAGARRVRLSMILAFDTCYERATNGNLRMVHSASRFCYLRRIVVGKASG